MILLIDNYDSFTFNLFQYLGELGAKVRVFRNDKISIEKIKRMRPEAIVISPGPGEPSAAGVCLSVINQLKNTTPILGVCLGHQAIAMAMGAKIIRAPKVMHGKLSEVFHRGQDLYEGIASPFRVTRYHSLIVERGSLPSGLEISAETKAGIVMGLRHKKFPIYGVQFHPESILTENGKTLLANFLGSL
jgi:anthranilate synthase/aminodeoxychorismate synthase-like glutamine amidotransferase